MSTRRLAKELNAISEYNSWMGMKQRCYNPGAWGYHRYGGRGIDVCDRYQTEGQVDRHEPEQRGTGFFLPWTRRDNASGNQTARQGRSG